MVRIRSLLQAPWKQCQAFPKKFKQTMCLLNGYWRWKLKMALIWKTKCLRKDRLKSRSSKPKSRRILSFSSLPICCKCSKLRSNSKTRPRPSCVKSRVWLTLDQRVLNQFQPRLSTIWIFCWVQLKHWSLKTGILSALRRSRQCKLWLRILFTSSSRIT